jgi:hypothetical protein
MPAGECLPCLFKLVRQRYLTGVPSLQNVPRPQADHRIILGGAGDLFARQTERGIGISTAPRGAGLGAVTRRMTIVTQDVGA